MSRRFKHQIQNLIASETYCKQILDLISPRHYSKQSRRLTKSELEGGGSQILFVAYLNKWAQVFLHSTRAILAIEISFENMKNNCKRLLSAVNLSG